MPVVGLFRTFPLLDFNLTRQLVDINMTLSLVDFYVTYQLVNINKSHLMLDFNVIQFIQWWTSINTTYHLADWNVSLRSEGISLISLASI